MRHRKSGIKLNRTSSHRKAMFRNMVTSLFKYNRIRTTDAKAKELRSWADHVITLAKRGDLHARRQALAIVREKAVVHKLFEEAETLFGSRQGGYTRVIKLGHRKGDAAAISLIELVTEEVATKPKKKKKKRAPIVKADVDKKAEAAPAAPPEATETAEKEAQKEDEDAGASKPSAPEATEAGDVEAAPKKVKKTTQAKKPAAAEEKTETPKAAKKKAAPKKAAAKAKKDVDASETPEKAKKKAAPKKKTE